MLSVIDAIGYLTFHTMINVLGFHLFSLPYANSIPVINYFYSVKAVQYKKWLYL